MSITAEPHVRPSSRTLVHRRATSDVFISDLISADDTSFITTAQLPRTHIYYNDHLGVHAEFDPYAALEAMRQATILYAHSTHNIDLESAFLFTVATLTVVAREPTPLPEVGPLEGQIIGIVKEWKIRNGQRTGYILSMTFTSKCGRIITAEFGAQWMPNSAWQKLRARQRAALGLEEEPLVTDTSSHERLSPTRLSRSNHRNIVIGAPSVSDEHPGLSFPIIVDQNYAGIFDHQLDHVPAAVMFEAGRQAAIYTGEYLFHRSTNRPMVTRIEASFEAIGELEIPTSISVSTAVEEAGRQKYGLLITQDDRVLTRLTIELAL
ncbi:AfsA-related hotdog domain-containing protein [Gordonia sputi]